MGNSGLSADLHITIGAAPLLGDNLPSGKRLSGFRLEHELLLVKAALLYGDRAKLYSPFASLVLRTVRFTEEPLKDRLRYLQAGAKRSAVYNEPVFFTPEDIEKYQSILRKSHPNNKQLQFKAQFEHNMKRFEEASRQLASDALADGIVEAMDAGLLEVHSFGPTLDAAMQYTDTAVDEFLAMMKAVVSDTTTYPLFDADLGGWIGAGIQDGSIAVGEKGATHGREIGLAARLLERLPVFDLATIREILDIRRELAEPLVRFRSGLMGFAAKIEHEQWDDDFAFDVDQVFRRDVAPAVLDIEDAVKSNRLLTTLARKIVDKPLILPGGSGLAAILSPFPHVVSATLGMAVSLGLLGVDAYKEWEQKQQAIERNQLYFYYAVGKQLEKLP
jgi:hypothetical protein